MQSVSLHANTIWPQASIQVDSAASHFATLLQAVLWIIVFGFAEHKIVIVIFAVLSNEERRAFQGSWGCTDFIHLGDAVRKRGGFNEFVWCKGRFLVSCHVEELEFNCRLTCHVRDKKNNRVLFMVKCRRSRALSKLWCFIIRTYFIFSGTVLDTTAKCGRRVFALCDRRRPSGPALAPLEYYRIQWWWNAEDQKVRFLSALLLFTRPWL